MSKVVPRALAVAASLFLAGCQSPALDLSGLAELPPLDYAVMVTGGAFAVPSAGGGTFVDGADPGVEALPIADVLAALRAGAVFQHAAADPDDDHRAKVLTQLEDPGGRDDLTTFCEAARDQGYDLLLVLEELQDRPIDAQGINGRWPVTLATWLLLGVGMFIPDHTFESRAVLRASLRDLQTGVVLSDHLLVAGPVDLSLVERGSFLGILLSIIVPPFWVQDDDENVLAGVREVTARRLLLLLARDLKSEAVRQRLRQRSSISFVLEQRDLVVESARSLQALRLRPENGDLPTDVVSAFTRDLLASVQRQGERLVYRAPLPAELPDGRLQVLGGTITGDVASATLRVGGGR